MTDTVLLSSTDDRGVATLTLNRPQAKNALNAELIAALCRAFRTLNEDAAVRAVVLTGAGETFTAGGDLSMMKAGEAPGEYDRESFSAMLRVIDHAPKPVLARVNGAAMGGGVGLAAVCDIVIASADAFFALSETRIGLIPAVISPFVVRAIGARQARRYFLTGERFGAEAAQDLGLVHETAPAADLDAAVEKTLSRVLACGPLAIAEAKTLIHDVAYAPVTDGLISDLEGRIARLVMSEEGQEGIAAFLQKRKPAWNPDR